MSCQSIRPKTHREQVLSFAGSYGHIELFGTVTPPRRSTEWSAARRALTVGGGGVAKMAAARRRSMVIEQNGIALLKVQQLVLKVISD